MAPFSPRTPWKKQTLCARELGLWSKDSSSKSSLISYNFHFSVVNADLCVFLYMFFFSPITTDPADEISPSKFQVMGGGCQGRENSKKSQLIG